MGEACRLLKNFYNNRVNQETSMKFICQQQDLAQALNVVSRAISANNTLPVLNNVLVKTENGRAVFIATNLEIAITARIPVTVIEEGGLTVPAKIFTNYVNLLQSGEVEIKRAKNETLEIKAHAAQSRIKGVAAEEFPLIPIVEAVVTFSLSGKVFSDMINKTSFAASGNLTRPVLSGVCFDLKTDRFTMVATDSYRLSEIGFNLIDRLEKSFTSIVPARTTIELGKIIGKYEDARVDVFFTKNQILFRVEDIELTSRLIEGVFPDYQKIIPAAKKSLAQVKRDDFLTALRKVSLFVPDNNCVKIEVKGDTLKLFTEETQVGSGDTSVLIALEGEENTIALNSQYLLDVLQVLDSENVFLELTDKLSPVVLRTEKDDNFLHIIMPLKV